MAHYEELISVGYDDCPIIVRSKNVADRETRIRPFCVDSNQVNAPFANVINNQFGPIL